MEWKCITKTQGIGTSLIGNETSVSVFKDYKEMMEYLKNLEERHNEVVEEISIIRKPTVI